jgi:hypothetical protein
LLRAEVVVEARLFLEELLAVVVQVQVATHQEQHL